MAALTSVRSIIGSLPGVYWTVWLGTLVNRMGGVVVPFLAIYLSKQRGLSSAQTGIFMGLYGLGALLAGLCGGVLADRVGRRRTMLLSLFGGAAAMIAIGLVDHLWALGLSTLLMSWVGEMYRPAVSALVADVVPVAQRTRAYGYLYWVVNLGFAISAVLGGLAAGMGYLLLFVIDGVTMAIYGVIVYWKVPETRPPVAIRAPRGGATAGLAQVLRDGPFLVLVGLVFGFAVGMWQSATAMPMDMSLHGIRPRVYGALSAINGIFIVVLQPRLTTWTAAWRKDRVLAWSSVALGVGLGLFAVTRHWLGYAVAIAVWTLGEMAYLPSVQSLVADLAPPGLRGRYQGLHGMAWGAASMVAPIVGGAVLDSCGGLVLWPGCLVLMVVVALGHLALGRRGAAVPGRATAPP